ncbi:MAG: ABC transporter permease [Bacteroidetes bacterium]|nr:ABC transporter permease [Bacteroidota bacterium]
MKKNRLIRWIAHRYLFSKKSHSVINIISIVSFLALAVPTAAMIILLSVQNGLNDFVLNLSSTFEPDIKIENTEGRYFTPNEQLIEKLSEIKNIETISEVIENDVMVVYKNKQSFIKIRGVDSLFGKVIALDSIIYKGTYDPNNSLIGLSLAHELGMGGVFDGGLKVYSPKIKSTPTFLPLPLYNSVNLDITGLFSLDTKTELSYVIIPITKAKQLFEKGNKITNLFIKGKNGVSNLTIKKDIEKVLAKNSFSKFRTTTQEEQNQAEYNILKQEKIIVFIILIMVLIIASFTLIGAIAMLMIEKEAESKLLATIGLKRKEIQKIFIYQGLYISLYGVALGTIVGLGISLLQQHFGFVKIEGASMLIDSYPVIVSIVDTAIAVITVIILSYMITAFTVKSIGKNIQKNEL